MKIQELIDKVKAVIYPNGVRAVEAEKHQALIIELLHAIEDEFNKRTPEEQGAVGNVLVKGLDGINEWVDTQADKLKVVELEQKVKDLQNTISQLNSGDSFTVEGGSTIDLPGNVLDAVADVKIVGKTDETKSVTTPMRVKSFKGNTNLVEKSETKYTFNHPKGEGAGVNILKTYAYMLEEMLEPYNYYTISVLLSGKGSFQPRLLGSNILADFYIDSDTPVWLFNTINENTYPTNIVNLYTRRSVGFDGTIHKIKIEKGDKATPWTPALSDLYVNDYTSNLYIKSNTQLESVGATSDFIKDGKLYKSVKNGEVVDTEITPIHTSGQVVAHPNGTIFFEPVVSLIRKYEGGISVDADLPLKKLDSLSTIDYATGVETALDVSKAVISGNSFTHPNIKDGDLVSFEYYYDESPIYGLNEAECYNSDSVLKDTITDELYKVVETVDNGVLTRKVEKL